MATAPRGVAPRTTEEAILSIRGAKPADAGRRPLTPLFAVLRGASVPALGVGEAIRDPGTLLERRSAIDLYRDRDAQMPGQALRGRGVIPGGKIGIGLGLAADILLDPTTYVTFGGSSAARRAGQVGAGMIDDIVKQGRRVTLAERAQASAASAAARAAAPKAISVGFRVPFTRGRTLLLGESRDLSRAFTGLGRRLAPERVRTKLAEGIRSGNGATPAVNEIYQDVRRLSAIEAGEMARFAKAGNEATRKAARKLGISHKQASEDIADFLSGMRADLPDELRDLATEARRLLDEQDAAEIVAGVEKGHLPDYIPFLIAKPGDRPKYDRLFGDAPTNAIDDPFFVKPRNTPDFATFKDLMRRSGIEPETNIWRLVERRGRASLAARQKKAIDDAVMERFGVNPPAVAIPETAGVAAKLTREQERLEEISRRRPTEGAQANAAAARQAEQEARAAYQASLRTGDPQAVAQARQALEETRAAAPEQVRAVVQRQAEEVLPRYAQIGRDLTATRARLPKPTAGRYVRTMDDRKAASIARRRVSEAQRRAKEVREAVAPTLRERVRAYVAQLDEAAAANRPISGRLGRTVRNDQNLRGADLNRDRYVFNARDDLRQALGRIGKRRRKTVAEFEQDYLEGLRDAAARGVDLDADEAAILRAVDQADDLAAQADEIQQALTAARGGDLAIDEATGAARLRELVQSDRVAIDSRARRARNSQGTGAEVGGEATSAAARERMARYFTPEATLSAEQRALREGAEAEVQQAIRKADRAVEKAERRLKEAQKKGSKRDINAARNALERATTNRRQARLALERARAGYVGSPREVAAQTKRVVKAEQKLTKAEQKAGAIRLANERLAARAGRQVGPEEWATLRGEWEMIGTATKYHDGTLLPPEIAEGLARVHKAITPTVKDEDAIQAISRFTREMTTRWKALALLSPGYHLRNLQDDGLRAWWAGARNPRSFVQANRALRGHGGSIKVRGGKVYTRDDIIRLAESEGVIRTGYVRTEIGSSADMIRDRRLAGPGRGPLARASSAVGDMREDTLRLGTFIELLKKGDDSTLAARTVREFLFDYGEVGAFVEAARRFWLPFITFTSKAIPLTIKTFATRPGVPANIAKTIAASEELAGNPDMSYLPGYAGSSFALPSNPTVRRLLGAPEDQELLLNPERVSGFATLDMLDPRFKPLQENWLGMVTPFVKSPVEAVTNYSTWRGRSFREGERVYSPRLVQLAESLGIPIAGSGPKRDSYTGENYPGYSPRLDTMLRTLPIFSQAGAIIPARKESTHIGALKWGLGLPLSPYDRVRGQYYAEKYGNK